MSVSRVVMALLPAITAVAAVDLPLPMPMETMLWYNGGTGTGNGGNGGLANNGDGTDGTAPGGGGGGDAGPGGSALSFRRSRSDHRTYTVCDGSLAVNITGNLRYYFRLFCYPDSKPYRWQ
jgi:hypothetical protein